MLAVWGHLVYRYRWPVLIVSGLAFGVSLWLMAQGGGFDTVFIPAESESGRALERAREELPAQPPSFKLIFSSRTWRATDPAFRAEVFRALEPLRRDPRVARVQTAYDAATPDARLISRDGRRSVATVVLKEPSGGGNEKKDKGDAYEALRAKVRSARLEVAPAGEIPLEHDFTQVAKKDIRRAELIVLPLVLLLLVLVFGSVLAAWLPLGVGLLAVAGGLASTMLLARFMSISIYATNIVVMIGLGVAIDYSLFVVSRFREEVAQHPIPTALASTLATAGRAILFSGATVAIGLLGLVFLRMGHLGSMGLAGTLVVSLSVLYGLTFLPAFLAILGPRVNAWRLPFLRDRGGDRQGFWHRLATLVMAHPWRVLLPVVTLLLVLGLPFLHIRLGPGDATDLPPTAESRRGTELLRRSFRGGDPNRIVVVVDYADGSPLAAQRIAELYDLSRWLAGHLNVSGVESPVDLDPRLNRKGYQQLYSLPPGQLPPGMQQALEQMVGEHIVTLVVSTPFQESSEEARALVRAIRHSHPPVSGELLVTGKTALDVDFIESIIQKAPLAIGLIVLVTYIVLFLLLGSVLLPLKAVLMNLLSITASYGALVWIFQDGHLARWLNFSPGPIETTTPIIMFCLLFGLSMDYEVLLLSRVREEYERTGDDTEAVAAGLERTGRLITGAAAIMAVVLFAFGFADMVVIKAIGIGMGLAVVVDATIVRALLVPATMRLLGRWNWWAPAPLARLHRHLDLAERVQRRPQRARTSVPSRSSNP